MVRSASIPHDGGMEPPAPPSAPTSEPSGSGAPPPPRRPGSIHDLRRSRHDRMLGGVAAGIARSYDWDPTLVRLAFVVAAVFGIGIPVYVVAWIVIPPEPDDGTAPATRETGPLVGLILLGVGVLWLGGRLVPNGDFADVIWPLTLIGGGIAVLVIRAGSPTDAQVDGAPGVTPEAGTDADTATETDGTADATTPDAEGRATSAATATTAAVTSSAWAEPAPWPQPPQPPRPARPRAPKPPRPRPCLGPLTVSALAVFAGVTALLASTGVLDVDLEVAGAIALGIVGTGLVVSAWFGRARGLVPLAILITIALGVVALIDTPLEGGIGDRSYRPASVRELEDEYRLAIGTMQLDLRDAPLRVGITDVTASVGIGELHVLVPADVTVEVHAEAGVGRVAVFGAAEGGVAVERDDTARPPGETSGAGTGARVLRLDLRTGIGDLNVERTPTAVPVPSDSGGLR